VAPLDQTYHIAGRLSPQGGTRHSWCKEAPPPDLVIFVDAPNGDNVAKFALAVSSLGNVRTRTVRAWSADEYRKLISELP
jgi:uncharacterized protein with GYD domain